MQLECFFLCFRLFLLGLVLHTDTVAINIFFLQRKKMKTRNKKDLLKVLRTLSRMTIQGFSLYLYFLETINNTPANLCDTQHHA